MLLKLSQEFGFRSGKCTSVNLTTFDFSCHLSLPPYELMEIANSCSWWIFRSRVCIHRLSGKKVYTVTVKTDLHKFCHLK